MMLPVQEQEEKEEPEPEERHDISWPAVDMVCDICVICATFCLMEMATRVARGGQRKLY